MKDLLGRYVNTGKQVRVTRTTLENYFLHGYLLDLSDTLALMHVVSEFHPDGYSVFRIADVEEVRCDRYDAWYDHIQRSEGLVGGLELSFRPDLTNMQTAIESIAQQYEHMIIECEELDDDDEDEDEDAADDGDFDEDLDEDDAEDDDDDDEFYIGSVMWTTPSNVVFRHFDAAGYWESQAADIDMEDITRVQFDAPYINTFAKYLREGEAPEDE